LLRSNATCAAATLWQLDRYVRGCVAPSGATGGARGGVAIVRSGGASGGGGGGGVKKRESPSKKRKPARAASGLALREEDTKRKRYEEEDLEEMQITSPSKYKRIVGNRKSAANSKAGLYHTSS
jgi:hypothetical protein